MKKNVKLLVVGLIAFVLSLNTAFAKEFKDLNSLGKDILAVNSKAEAFYLVGEYAFTTAYNTTVQDVMLAARSINVKDTNGKLNTDPIFKEMTIYTIDAHYNNNGEIDGWNIGKTLYGDNTLEADLASGINVEYIDYNKTYYHVNADELLASALENIHSDYFDIQLKEDGGLEFTVKDRTVKISDLEGSKTGVFQQLLDVLNNNPGITSFTIKTNDGKTLTIDVNDLAKGYEDFKTFVKNVTGKNYEDALLNDLVGKKFTGTITVDEETTVLDDANGKNSKDYTVDFVNVVVDTNEIVDKYVGGINNELYGVTRSEDEFTVNVKDVAVKIEEGMKSGVMASLVQLLLEDNIKEVRFADSAAKVSELVITKTTSVDEIKAWLKTNSNALFNKSFTDLTNEDLVGKSFTFKIAVDEDKAIAKEEITYTVTFTADKYTVTYRYDDAESTTKEYYPGKTLENPESFNETKEGYKFVGWFDETNTLYEAGTSKVTGNVTLTAKWIKEVKEEEVENYITEHNVTRNDIVTTLDSENNIINLEIKMADETLDSIKGTGFIEAMAQLLAKDEILRAEISYGNSTERLEHGSTIGDVYRNALLVLMHITGKPSSTEVLDCTLRDIAGTKFIVRVYLDPNKAVDASDNDVTYYEYTVKFNAENVLGIDEVAEISEAAQDAVNNSVGKIYSLDVKGNEITVNYNNAFAEEDVLNILSGGMGTGLNNCLGKFFENEAIKSFTILNAAGSDLKEIDKDNYSNVSTDLIKSIAEGLGYSKAQIGTLMLSTQAEFFNELAGKTVNIRVNLAEGYSFATDVDDIYTLKIGTAF